MSTIGTIELIATIDTSKYTKGAADINKANADIANGSASASDKSERSWVKSGAIIGAVAGAMQIAVSKAFSLISSSIGSAVKRVDTLNNSTRTFENMGFSAGLVTKTMDDLKKSILGLPTPLDSAVRNVQLLAASTSDLSKSQKIFKALNDGIIGFGGSAEQVDTAVIQLSQAFAGGKIMAQDWNSMLNAGLGPTLNAIAKKMGVTTTALKEGLSDGSISVTKFQNALIDLDKNGGGGMQSLEKIVKDSTSGIGTGWANMQTAIVRGMADIINSVGSTKISGAISTFGKFVETGLKGIAGALPPIITAIQGQIDRVTNAFKDTQNKINSNDYKGVGVKVGAAIASALHAAMQGIRISSEIIGKWFSSIDWGQLGVKIGRQSVAFLVGFVIGLSDFDMGAIFKTLAANWLPAVIGLVSLLFAPSKLLGPIGKILSKLPFAKLIGKFMIEPIRGLGGGVRSAVADLFGGVGKSITSKFSAITTTVKTLGQIITAPFRWLLDTLEMQIRLLPLTISNALNSVVEVARAVLLAFKNVFTDIFKGIVGVIKTILEPLSAFFGNLFSGIWGNIQGLFTGVGDFFGLAFIRARLAIQGAIGNIVTWFAEKWAGIQGVFIGVADWFGGMFARAWEFIKGAFSGVGSFFSGIWSTIVQKFGDVGTSVGNAIGRTFKSVINTVIRGAVNIINDFIRSINSIIGVINKLPGPDIGKIGELGVPQLAKGGIVSSPTLAMIGEGKEPEAVIPLSKLNSILSGDRVNNSTSNHKITINLDGVMTRSKSDLRVVAKQLVGALNEELAAKGQAVIGGGAI